MMFLVILISFTTIYAEDLNEQLVIAAKNGKLETVEALLANGADENTTFGPYGTDALVWDNGNYSNLYSPSSISLDIWICFNILDCQ